MLRKNAAGARAAFERALQLDPSQPDALQALGTLDVRAGNHGRGARTDGAASESRAEKRGLRMIAAQTYIALGDLASAERALREAIELDSANIVAYGLLGQIYVSQRKLNEARIEFEQVAKRLPKAAAPPTMIGMIHELQNNKEEARRWYEKALAIDTNAPVAANNLAWMTAEQGGNLDVALQLAQTAKARLPDSHQVDDTLGWVYYKKGLHTLAIGSFQSSIQKDPKNPVYHYHLGLAYAKTATRTRHGRR